MMAERHTDQVIVAAGKQNLKAMVAELRALPKPTAVAQHEPIEVPERD